MATTVVTTTKPFNLPVPSVSLLEAENKPVSLTWYRFFAALYTGLNQGQASGVAFTPTDLSGAGLVFSGVVVRYAVIGGLVHYYGQFDWPTTTDPTISVISLPVKPDDSLVANVPCVVSTSADPGVDLAFRAVAGALTARGIFINRRTSANVTNAALSGLTISFMLIYQAG